MLYLVFFILGVLIGQWGLLAYARMKLGYEGWQMVNSFADAWMNGEVERTEDDEDEE